MMRKTYGLLLLLTAIIIFPSRSVARESKPLTPNYPLHLIQHIYGYNKNNVKDTPDKGGTLVSCAQNSNGHLYLLYSGNRSEVQILDRNGKMIFRFGERGDQDGQFSGYTGSLDINSRNEVLVTDVKKRKIVVFDHKGTYLRSFSSVQGLVPRDPKQETYPVHMAVGSEDQIFISDGRNGHVGILDAMGRFIKHFKGSKPGLFPSAGHIRFDSQGRVFILEGIPNRIQVCAPNGDPIMIIGETGNRAGQFLRISGMAIDSRNRIYATDIVQCVVQIFTPEGDLIGVVKEYISPDGNTIKFVAPSGIFIGLDDHIYVIEQSMHRLVVLKYLEKTGNKGTQNM